MLVSLWVSLLVIAVGASVGAWLRWGLGLWLNAILPAMPLGTLVANLSGGYLIGLAMAFFMQHPGIAPEWRLLIVTGFLGGLTTFSTFSAELFSLVARGQILAGMGVAAAHLLGSLAMTALGVWSYSQWRG